MIAPFDVQNDDIFYFVYLLLEISFEIHSIFSQQLFLTSCSMPMWNQLNLLIFVKFEKNAINIIGNCQNYGMPSLINERMEIHLSRKS